MSTEGDVLITKATVILERPADYIKWLFLRKDSAERNQLWEYVNPSLREEEVKKIEKEKPQAKEVKEFYTGASQGDKITILDLPKKDVLRYKLWLKVYSRKEAQWSTKEKALEKFNHEISRTIASRHIHLISNCATPYDSLRALKKHLCPSTSERNYQLEAHYQGLLTVPKRNNLDSWFEDWLDTTLRMKEAALPEVAGNRAQEDFIRAIRGLDESWATHQLIELVRKDQEEVKFTGISDLVAEYRSYYRRFKPIASGLGSYATLGVSEQRQKERRNLPTARQPSSPPRPQCPCGEKHLFQDCLYINQSLRSPEWKGDQEIVRRFDQLRAGPGPRAAALRHVEKELSQRASALKASDRKSL